MGDHAPNAVAETNPTKLHPSSTFDLRRFPLPMLTLPALIIASVS